MRNYARNRSTGELVFFRGSAFRPLDPQNWATWHATAEPRFHRIGETEMMYRLRLMINAGHREPVRIQHALEMLDVNDPAWLLAYERARELTTWGPS